MAEYQSALRTQTLHQLFITKTKDSGVFVLLNSLLNNDILQAGVSEQLKAMTSILTSSILHP